MKGRPAEHPVIVHLADADAARRVGGRRPRRRARARGRVLARTAHARACGARPRVADEVTGGLDTVGLRVPDHPLALELLDAFGGGLAAPSANRFGRVSPTTADARARRSRRRRRPGARRRSVRASASSRRSSTARRPTPRVLRVGGVTARAARRGRSAPSVAGRRREAARPGTLASHYAPRRTRRGRRRPDALAARARRVLAARRARSACSRARDRALADRAADRDVGHTARRRRVRPRSCTRALREADDSGSTSCSRCRRRRRASGARSPIGSGGPPRPTSVTGVGMRSRSESTSVRSGCSTPASAASPCCGRSSTSCPHERPSTSATPAGSRTAQAGRRGAEVRARDRATCSSTADVKMLVVACNSATAGRARRARRTATRSRSSA